MSKKNKKSSKSLELLPGISIISKRVVKDLKEEHRQKVISKIAVLIFLVIPTILSILGLVVGGTLWYITTLIELLLLVVLIIGIIIAFIIPLKIFSTPKEELEYDVTLSKKLNPRSLDVFNSMYQVVNIECGVYTVREK